jgi:cyclic-di-AMP phosphodiesterase PgpH
MQNPLNFLNRNSNDIIRYILLAASVVAVLLIIPKKGKFKYEYEQGKPWMHEDLSAPFTFAILKTQKEIQTEQNEIKENFKPYYSLDTKVENTQKDKFIKDLTETLKQEGYLSNNLKKFYLSKGLGILDDIYEKGIINLDTLHKAKPKEFIITEVKNASATEKPIASYYTLPDARASIIERTEKDSILNQGWLMKSLLSALAINVTYDKRLSEKKLDEQLNANSTTRGVIKQDEKIIARGSLVTPERYRVLESLRKEYETNIGKSYTIPLGYLILIASLFLMFAINLELFHQPIASNPRSMVLILINIILFVAICSYITISGKYSIYSIPFCIVPIVLLAFFGIRIAILTHLLIVFLCALIVPDPFEFILLQSFAGFTAVLSLSRLRYISQFFVSSMLIFLSYALIYFGISFIKTSTLKEVPWQGLQWFGVNFILSLLAYPLVYVHEKIFGFLSDISLLELADIHNKVLKELFVRAPGTFQHSLQVSNLVEAVMDRIGGNALLARVGALYHDIGKLYNPDYFTENQRAGLNPHDTISELESAEIIIGHVAMGVALAQKNHIPARIIDFIRSHHGTTRVEFFYRNYMQDHDMVNEEAFRYPGPKPSSKEMAVVMIVDSVEAALRSLQNPEDKEIDALVDKMIDAKIQDNQFDNANITIQEINTVRRILKKLMKSIYHIRIQYPAAPVQNKN